MGYLDGSTITVDAILTGEGRKKLANGAGLGITNSHLVMMELIINYGMSITRVVQVIMVKL